MTPLLQVENLQVAFSTRHGVVQALHGIDITLQGSETLGIVGESGSGKSVTSLAVMRLLDRAGRITGGRIRFEGRDITNAAHADLRRLRGSALSMIFQNPRAALNPIRTVERQIVDVLAAHGRLSQASARAQALELLRAVRIRDPEARLSAYPHELSGGMCQRVMIAMAIACEPALLIADEPTTGLDVTTQQTVMELLASIKAERGMAMILITHDLGLAARWCDRIAVMEAGRVVEQGATERLFEAPAHPYTRRLVAASPTRHSTLADLALDAPEVVPRPIERKAGTPPLLELQRIVKSFGGPTPRRRRCLVPLARQEARWAWWANRARARAPCRVWSAAAGSGRWRHRLRRRIDRSHPGTGLPQGATAARHPDRVPGSERQPQSALHHLR